MEVDFSGVISIIGCTIKESEIRVRTMRGQVTRGGGSKQQGCMRGVRKRGNLVKGDAGDREEGCGGRHQSIWGRRNRGGSPVSRLMKDGCVELSRGEGGG
ncbi:hypothetical protein FXO38_16678 [Capsicum annuum]|nr:hypothetical protein FXO38_16678 [Capsicum annuum]